MTLKHKLSHDSKTAPEVFLLGIIPRIGINYSSPKGGNRGKGEKKIGPGGAQHDPKIIGKYPPGPPQGPGGQF